MLLELFVIFEVLTIGLFFTAFFSKNEVIWALSGIFSGLMMMNSFNVQYYVYEYNTTLLAYQPIMVSFGYTYLAWMNGIFLALTMVFGLFDIFDKYGEGIKSKLKQ